MQTSENRADAVRTLGEKIRGFTIAMMTTIEDDGTLHTRPMATPDTEFSGDLWFFTLASAPTVGELEHDRHVSISYAKPDDNLYVSVAGTAQLVRDRQRMQDLWQDSLRTWFPRGLEDPDLALLRVQAQRAQYWDGTSSDSLNLGA